MKILYLALTILISGLHNCSANNIPTNDVNSTTFELVTVINPKDDCRLPCFAGLTVSMSSVSQVVSVIENLDEINSEGDTEKIENTYNFAASIEPEGVFSIALEVDRDLLNSISTRISNPESWSVIPNVAIYSISLHMGIPDEIYVIFFGPPAGYSVLFIFEEQRAALQYQFIVNSPQVFQDEDSIPFCEISSELTTLEQVNIWVMSDEQQDWILDIMPDLFDDRETRPWRRLEILTGMNEQQFFDNVGLEECFHLVSFGELRSLGYRF